MKYFVMVGLLLIVLSCTSVGSSVVKSSANTLDVDPYFAEVDSIDFLNHVLITDKHLRSGDKQQIYAIRNQLLTQATSDHAWYAFIYFYKTAL